MADSTTSNVSLTKPEVGASADTWGTKINTNFDTLDNLFTTGPALLISKGGTSSTTASGARTALGLGTVAVEDTVPVAKGGTGSTTLTANNVLLGNGTSALQAVAPSTNGNVLTSNGTTWTSAAPAVSYAGPNSQVFTSSGTFTVPTGITSVRVRVFGGGGGGDNSGYGTTGGGGGFVEASVSGLTSGAGITVTVGAGGTSGTLGNAGGSSSFGSYATATGGAASGNGGGSYGYQGSGSTTGTIIQRNRGNVRIKTCTGDYTQDRGDSLIAIGAGAAGYIGSHNCGNGGGAGGGGMSGGSSGGGNQSSGQIGGHAFGPGSDGAAGAGSVVGGVGGAGGVIVFW